jgi:regulatory protein
LSELQSHGIQGDALNGIKAGLAESEVERACEVWRRKFNSIPSDPKERAKQMRFLQQRGFSLSAIQAAMRTVDDEDER